VVSETIVIDFASQGCGESAQCTCIGTALYHTIYVAFSHRMNRTRC